MASSTSAATTSIDDIKIYSEIGRGAFSVVYKGRLKQSITFVALKSVERAAEPKVQREVRAMYGLAHANVLRFHAWYRTANHLWTVSEYCAGGDLRKLLSQDGVLPEPTVMSFGVDALAGLQCVHRHELLMVDLQPQHLLVDEHGLVKLADFGAALRVGDAAVRDGVAAAPAAHRPPEAGVGAPLSFASDFWALGSLLHELITGRRPFALRAHGKMQSIIREYVRSGSGRWAKWEWDLVNSQ